VRSLEPEHEFSAWVERWLTNIDRSLIGAQLLVRQMALSAEQGDAALAALSDLGASTGEVDRLHDREFDFLRRARDVINAATTLIEKPRQWQVILGELVATATSNIFEDSRRSEFAELAVQVVSASKSERQLSEPTLLRRRDDERPKKPGIRAYAVYQQGELKIVGRSPGFSKH